MAKNVRDLYAVWEAQGELETIKAFISDCYKKLITQREMCKYLNITEKTFSMMKKDHPDIAELKWKAQLDLKKELGSALYKKAIGYELVEEEQFIEDRGSGKEQKRKIHRTKKQIGPDYKSIVYLLTKHFGKEYSERYEELKLAEKKIEGNKEEWNSDIESETCE